MLGVETLDTSNEQTMRVATTMQTAVNTRALAMNSFGSSRMSGRRKRYTSFPYQEAKRNCAARVAAFLFQWMEQALSYAAEVGL